MGDFLFFVELLPLATADSREKPAFVVFKLLAGPFGALDLVASS